MPGNASAVADAAKWPLLLLSRTRNFIWDQNHDCFIAWILLIFISLTFFCFLFEREADIGKHNSLCNWAWNLAWPNSAEINFVCSPNGQTDIVLWLCKLRKECGSTNKTTADNLWRMQVTLMDVDFRFISCVFSEMIECELKIPWQIILV